MDFSLFVWVTEATAINLDHVTSIRASEGSVEFWDAQPQGEGPLLTLRGVEGERFLRWFTAQSTAVPRLPSE